MEQNVPEVINKESQIEQLRVNEGRESFFAQ